MQQICLFKNNEKLKYCFSNVNYYGKPLIYTVISKLVQILLVES